MNPVRLFKSFGDALRGLQQAFKTEQNFRIQVVVGILAIAAAFLLSLHTWEIILVILLVTLVLTVELLNTAFEYVTDLLKPRLNYHVFLVKDVMAGAVLVTSVGALIMGVIIFYPHFINIFK